MKSRFSPLYSIKPILRKRFMKKLTRERVVPTISARVAWLILGNGASGLVFAPGLRKQE